MNFKLTPFAAFSAALLTFGLEAGAQTFTDGMVDYGDGSSNMFASSDIGPDGKFYALWRDGGGLNQNSNIMPSYKLIRWDGSAWTHLGTIPANTIPNFTLTTTSGGLHDRMGLQVDGQGRYHIVVQGYNSVRNMIVYGTSADGTTWNFHEIENNGGTINFGYSDPHIDLDENDRPHIVFRQSNRSSSDLTQRWYAIRHYAFNGSTWSGETVFTQNHSSNEITTVSYAMDHNGKGHISFCWENNGSGTDGSLAYITNAAGSWSVPQVLAQGSTGAAASSRTTLAVDSNNKVHILRRDHAYNLYYHTNKSGSFTNSALGNNLKGNFDHIHSLAINGQGDVFAVYNTFASDAAVNEGILKYACLFNGTSTWQTGTAFTGNKASSQYTCLEFNDQRQVMILTDHFTNPGGPGNPSFTPVYNSRQLQYITGFVLPPSVAPTVSTPTHTSVTTNSATLGGNVTSDGGAAITARGVVFSQTATNTNPQLGGNGVTNVPGTGTTGVFTVGAGDLSDGISYTYRAYATNASGTTYSNTSTFTTLVANAAPLISVSGNATADEGSLATKSGTFSDAQGNSTVTLSVTSGPGIVTRDNTNGTWQWSYTPADGPAGPTQVIITATDNGSPALSNSASFSFSVDNVPPTAIAQTGSNAITVLEDSSATPITLAATDPAGANDPLTYSVSAVTPSGAGTLSGGTGPNRTFTPAENFHGSASFNFTASDGDGGTSSPATVEINVTPVNDAPTLAAISNITVDRNSGAGSVDLSGISPGPSNESTQTVSVVAVSSNPSLVPNPSVSYSGGSSASLSYTPAENQTGTAVITVTAQDSGGTSNNGVDSVVRIFDITVRPFSFEAWQEKNFTGSALQDPDISGPDANPDGDARVNAWEYALGTDPLEFDPEPILSLSLETGSGSTRTAGYGFTKDLNAADATLALETGVSGTFAPAGGSPVTTPLAGTIEGHYYSDSSSVGTAASRQARLVLNLAPESQARTSEVHATRAFTVTAASGTTAGTTFASAPLAEPRLALGTIGSLGTATLTAEANAWPTDLLASGPAYLVLTSGSAKGQTTDLVSYTGGILTLGDDLTGIAAAGDNFEIRLHHTLTNVFGRTHAGSLASGSTSTDADNVQYARTDGSFEIFFHSTASGSDGWRSASMEDESQRVIYPEQSFVVKRKAASAVTLFQQGVLNHDGGSGNGGEGAAPQVPIQTGTNLVTSPGDRTITLADLGLYTGDPATGVAAATSAANADRIVVPQPNGTQKTYFYHPTLGWLNSSFQPAGTLEFPPGTPFYIIRKAPREPFIWELP